MSHTKKAAIDGCRIGARYVREEDAKDCKGHLKAEIPNVTIQKEGDSYVLVEKKKK